MHFWTTALALQFLFSSICCVYTYTGKKYPHFKITVHVYTALIRTEGNQKQKAAVVSDNNGALHMEARADISSAISTEDEYVSW